MENRKKLFSIIHDSGELYRKDLSEDDAVRQVEKFLEEDVARGFRYDPAKYGICLQKV